MSQWENHDTKWIKWGIFKLAMSDSHRLRQRGEYCVAVSGLPTQPNCCNINLYRNLEMQTVSRRVQAMAQKGNKHQQLELVCGTPLDV